MCLHIKSVFRPQTWRFVIKRLPKVIHTKTPVSVYQCRHEKLVRVSDLQVPLTRGPLCVALFRRPDDQYIYLIFPARVSYLVDWPHTKSVQPELLRSSSVLAAADSSMFSFSLPPDASDAQCFAASGHTYA